MFPVYYWVTNMKKLSQTDIAKELINITHQLLTESGELHHREVRLDASLQRHLGIDSLGRAELFQRIERAFKVSLPDQLLKEAETLADIAAYLAKDDADLESAKPQQKMTSHSERSRVDPSETKTLIDVLLLYGEYSSDKAHIYFQNEKGTEEVITYGHLLKNSLRVAFGLSELGLREGESVAIMLPTSPEFFYTFLGILLAGGIPVPIYPPFRTHMLEAYAQTEAKILTNAEVRILITFEQAEKLSLLLKPFVPSLKHVCTFADVFQTKELTSIFHAKATSFAFIQYTSGSTAAPKGVLLTHYNLLSNIRAYGQSIHIRPDDVAVSWLPLYHDMGLIGMWLGSLYYGVPLILLTPFTFLNHPERWLWAIHYHRGTLSGAPNFAYELCIRKIDPALIEGLDLSSWRMAINGAEKIYPRTLEQFAKKFAPYGFKRTALLPVYGLAESTVGLLIPPLEREFRVDYIDRKEFEEHSQAITSNDSSALSFVSCGMPLLGHDVRIVDSQQTVLPERHVGSLQFRGPSSMQGYYNNPEATAAIYHDGWLDSGDLAYKADGEFFITGRRKDLIIKAGRNIYPSEIEDIVGSIQGVRQGCVIAFGATDEKLMTEQLIVVAEMREKNKAEREEIIEKIKEEVATRLDIVPDHIVLVPPQTVPKTSSGKLQRAQCKRMYMENRLGKKKIPPWLQIAKLGFQAGFRSLNRGLSLFGKLIYTSYVVLLLLISFFPIFLLIHMISRDHVAKVCKKWARCLLALAFCPIKVVGAERLKQDKPVIFTPNHASYIDSVVMLAILPIETRFVGKKELLSTPFLRTFMHKLGYIPVNRIDLSKGIEDTKHIEETLKTGVPILIFPEGTFGYSSGLRPFRLGAFKIATETNTPICPIALHGTRQIWRGDEKLIRPGKINITICDLIQPKGLEWQAVTQLRNEVRDEIVKYCGEPSLDFIAAQTIAPPKPKERNTL